MKGKSSKNENSKTESKLLHYCPVEGCSSFYRRSDGVLRHLRTVHMIDTKDPDFPFPSRGNRFCGAINKEFSCIVDVCFRSYSRFDSMLRHLRRIHDIHPGDERYPTKPLSNVPAVESEDECETKFDRNSDDSNQKILDENTKITSAAIKKEPNTPDPDEYPIAPLLLVIKLEPTDAEVDLGENNNNRIDDHAKVAVQKSSEDSEEEKSAVLEKKIQRRNKTTQSWNQVFTKEERTLLLELFSTPSGTASVTNSRIEAGIKTSAEFKLIWEKLLDNKRNNEAKAKKTISSSLRRALQRET